MDGRTSITVHYRAPGSNDCLCGYSPRRGLFGLDYAETWGVDIPHPVTCAECRLKGPRPKTLRRKMRWESGGGGKRRN